MKLKVSDFTGVKLKVEKKPDGELFINFTPIIKHANKLIKENQPDVFVFPMDRFYVFYVDNCNPRCRKFASEKAAVRFADKHEKKNVGEYSDNWVDAVFLGHLIKKYKGWYGK